MAAQVQEPTLSLFDPATADWTQQAWSNTYGDVGPGSYVGHKSSGTSTSPDAPTTEPLNQRRAAVLPTSQAGTIARVQWPLMTTVSADIDNATVGDWRQGIHVDCGTAVTDASASGDFDL